MSQKGCSGSALSAGDLAAAIARASRTGAAGTAAGGTQGSGSLAAAVAGISRTNQGVAGQAGMVVGEMRDSASRENISSRRSAPLLTGPRLEGLRNRLLLKYVCVDYEFFNTPDQVFR